MWLKQNTSRVNGLAIVKLEQTIHSANSCLSLMAWSLLSWNLVLLLVLPREEQESEVVEQRV